MFDATALEVARHAHAYEMGAETAAERRWSRWYESAKMSIQSNGWCGFFDNGKSRGLDGCEWEDGFSIDSASDAFDAGQSVQQYVEGVRLNRLALGLVDEIEDPMAERRAMGLTALD